MSADQLRMIAELAESMGRHETGTTFAHAWGVPSASAKRPDGLAVKFPDGPVSDLDIRLWTMERPGLVEIVFRDRPPDRAEIESQFGRLDDGTTFDPALRPYQRTLPPVGRLSVLTLLVAIDRDDAVASLSILREPAPDLT